VSNEVYTYRLPDLVGKKIYAGSRGIYIYKVNKSGRRYRATTIAPHGLIGVFEKYQIFDAKQVGKPKETWVLFFEGGGFIFLPKAEKNLIDVSKLKGQGVKTEEQQIEENTNKYNAGPFDNVVNNLKETILKNPAVMYIIVGLVAYKILSK
jgi:hypothetical protein